MPVTASTQHDHLRRAAECLQQAGEALLALAALTLPEERTEPTAREHYSQSARDRRQYPVLAAFRPFRNHAALPWEGEQGIKALALANGYTSLGLGGFFTGPNALLEWADAEHATVRITVAGISRVHEIEARGLIAA